MLDGTGIAVVGTVGIIAASLYYENLVKVMLLLGNGFALYRIAQMANQNQTVSLFLAVLGSCLTYAFWIKCEAALLSYLITIVCVVGIVMIIIFLTPKLHKDIALVKSLDRLCPGQTKRNTLN